MNELLFLNNSTKEQTIIDFYLKFGIELKYIDTIKSFAIIKYYYKIVNNTKIKKIENLIQELEMALQVKKIHFSIDNIKGLICFEVAKNTRDILYFDELEDTIRKGLTACVGKDTNNNEIYIDITKTPHLLVAGSTGSGKSCLINNIITSLFNKYNERELQTILVDVKQVEFIQYNGNEHLAVDTITEVKEAFSILNKMVVIMNNRYNILSKKGCKNIKKYNEKEAEKMNYFLVIIDEVSDLLMQLPEIEDIICRLAQLGRAAGIHLIIATQRPDCKTITGKLKANIPSRLALTVTSAINSRIILDEPGAEKLTGCGDFILKMANGEKVRGQGALIRE